MKKDASKPANIQAFAQEKAAVLHKTEMTELKGGRRSAIPRPFSTVFLWSTCCGGPVPQ